jgi:hypothetical protein
MIPLLRDNSPIVRCILKCREAHRSLVGAPRCRVLQYRPRSRRSRERRGSKPPLEQLSPALVLPVWWIAGFEPVLALHSVSTFSHDSFQILLKTHELLNDAFR